jgi:short-subunit dehydrogenase
LGQRVGKALGAVKPVLGCGPRYNRKDRSQRSLRSGDLEQVADRRAIFAALDEAFGRIDILVNAAGITDRGDSIPVAIINIGSTAALVGQPFISPYCA